MDRTAMRLQRWLTLRGLAGASERDLLAGLSDQLRDAGVPLWRSIFALDTLHPIVGGHLAEWRFSQDEVAEREYPRLAEEPEDWLNSPLYVLDQSEQTQMRWRLDDLEPGRFPLLDQIKAEGGRDYLAFQTDFRDPEPIGTVEEIFTSWTSDTGFEDHHVELIGAVIPAFALAIKSVTITRVARSLLATYLGDDPAQRVLKGEIERGRTQMLRAIIWFSDLKGFTRTAERSGAEQLVPLLNAYADCLVKAVHGHGGQVLKFIGDGLLATFELDDGGSACGRALDAAITARREVAALNEARARDGLPVTDFDLALHVGEVLYGNIGSRDRLDFTVLGPAVNQASRIEAMCDALDQPVVVSAAFLASAPDCRSRLVSLGRYMLRGVARPQELFTLDPEAEANGR